MALHGRRIRPAVRLCREAIQVTAVGRRLQMALLVWRQFRIINVVGHHTCLFWQCLAMDNLNLVYLTF